MEKKKIVIGIIFLTVISLGLALMVTSISSSVKNTKSMDQNKADIIGEWEDPFGVSINFTKQGAFQMFGDDVAVYSLDPRNKKITFKYAGSYGGQEIIMDYTLEANSLVMHNTSTGETQTYTRK